MSECPFELPIRSHKSDDGFYRIRGNNGRAICKDIAAKDEADYIVRAVNSHKDLVEALKKYGHHSTPEICCEASLKEGGKCTCGFEAALAKAQPKQSVG